MMKDISKLIGTRYPIIQGAMGAISNPEMVAAVSEAGGCGILATAFITDLNTLDMQIHTVRKLTNQPFGVNLMIMNPMSQRFAQLLLERRVNIVTTSGGSPEALTGLLKGHGIKVLHVSSTVKSAIKAEKAGADAVIAEGSESGGIQGHNGASTMVLVPSVVDAVGIPVVAAGGIGDARTYRAAFSLGARGVQVGTRFIASEECIAHHNYKQAVLEASETDTLLLHRKKMRVRVVRTPLAETLWGSRIDEKFPLAEKREAAWIKGDLKAYTLPCGQIAGMIKEIMPVRKIIEEMVTPDSF